MTISHEKRLVPVNKILDRVPPGARLSLVNDNHGVLVACGMWGTMVHWKMVCTL